MAAAARAREAATRGKGPEGRMIGDQARLQRLDSNCSRTYETQRVLGWYFISYRVVFFCIRHKI